MGLGPDEVMMNRWAANETMGGNWTVHLAKWEEEGRPGGIPPGLHEVPRESINRDYRAVKTSYLLRPEVSNNWLLIIQPRMYFSDPFFVYFRPWRVFISSGKLQAMSGGENGVGLSLNLLKSMRGQSMGMPVS